MIIDAAHKFNIQRALNGDKEAMCKVVDAYAEDGDWVRSANFLEMLVDVEPKACEKMFAEITGEELSYGEMLKLIGQSYYHEKDDRYSAYKWFNKYFEYLDFKYRNHDADKLEKLKQEFDMYDWMKSQNVLDIPHFRFLLKWELELFYSR